MNELEDERPCFSALLNAAGSLFSAEADDESSHAAKNANNTREIATHFVLAMTRWMDPIAALRLQDDTLSNFLTNKLFIKNRRKDLPPKKITRRSAKSHPSTHRKRSFFGDFLSKIFYMTHRETYREKCGLEKRSKPSKNHFSSTLSFYDTSKIYFCSALAQSKKHHLPQICFLTQVPPLAPGIKLVILGKTGISKVVILGIFAKIKLVILGKIGYICRREVEKRA